MPLSLDAVAEDVSDQSLLDRVRAGDDRAFGEIYERHHGALCLVARRHSAPGTSPDDIVAEAFTALLALLRRGRGPETHVKAYLFTVVRHGCARSATQHQRVRPVDMAELDERHEDEDRLVAADESQLIRAAFRALPTRWQTVLWHVDVERRSPSDVAGELGMSANAVSSLARRAREGLRRRYLEPDDLTALSPRVRRATGVPSGRDEL